LITTLIDQIKDKQVKYFGVRKLSSSQIDFHSKCAMSHKMAVSISLIQA